MRETLTTTAETGFEDLEDELALVENNLVDLAQALRIGNIKYCVLHVTRAKRRLDCVANTITDYEHRLG